MNFAICCFAVKALLTYSWLPQSVVNDQGTGEQTVANHWLLCFCYILLHYKSSCASTSQSMSSGLTSSSSCGSGNLTCYTFAAAFLVVLVVCMVMFGARRQAAPQDLDDASGAVAAPTIVPLSAAGRGGHQVDIALLFAAKERLERSHTDAKECYQPCRMVPPLRNEYACNAQKPFNAIAFRLSSRQHFLFLCT